MAHVEFNNIIAFNGNGGDILSPLVTSIFDQDLWSFELNNNTAELLGCVTTQALTPDQKFRASIGAYELDEIDEGDDFPIMKTGMTKEKGFAIKQYANQIPITKLFMKWIETAKTLEWADTSVKQEIGRLADNITALRRGKVKIVNQVALKVLTQGFSISATNGPGSATAYGQALFSAAHPYGQGVTAGTFQNVLGGTWFGTLNGVLNATNLQGALNVLKQSCRLQNGDRVDTPSVYKLLVSRANAVNARTILNTANSQAGMFAGTGSNAMLLNQFNFNGNKVEIVELPYLGGRDGKWATIGSDTMWFVMDTEGANMAKALRMIKLYDAETGAYTNDSTKTSYVTIDLWFTVDHYGLESYIVGSQGTV